MCNQLKARRVDYDFSKIQSLVGNWGYLHFFRPFFILHYICLFLRLLVAIIVCCNLG